MAIPVVILVTYRDKGLPQLPKPGDFIERKKRWAPDKPVNTFRLPRSETEADVITKKKKRRKERKKGKKREKYGIVEYMRMEKKTKTKKKKQDISSFMTVYTSYFRIHTTLKLRKARQSKKRLVQVFFLSSSSSFFFIFIFFLSSSFFFYFFSLFFFLFSFLFFSLPLSCKIK